MANWQRRLDLADLFDAYHEDYCLNTLAGAVAKRVRLLKPFGDEILDERLEEIAELFEDLSQDDAPEIDDFDGIMSELYDWADTALDNNWDGKKVCWVETMNSNRKG